MACRQLEYVCISEKSDTCSLCICYLKVVEGKSLLALLVHGEFVTAVHFSNIFMVVTSPCLKSYQRIYSIDFLQFSSFQNQIFGCVCLSVPNCRLVENSLDTFCIAQIWDDLSILGMFTVAKCRGHTNFTLSKMCTLKLTYLEI